MCVYLRADHERGFIFYDLMMPPFEICTCVTTWRWVRTHASVNAYTHLVMDGYFNLCVFLCVIKLNSYFFALWCSLLFCVRVITHICCSVSVCLCLKTMQEFIPADQGSNSLFYCRGGPHVHPPPWADQGHSSKGGAAKKAWWVCSSHWISL